MLVPDDVFCVTDTVDLPLAKSYAVFTAFGVADSVSEVDDVDDDNEVIP